MRAGGPIPNNYDQLWTSVCLKYTQLYLAQVAAVQQGGRKGRHNRTYKHSRRHYNRKTYKHRKTKTQKLKSYASKTNVV